VRESAAAPSSSNSESSNAGSLIVYFSVAQLPRSCSWQRSLQNGNSASVAESVGFLQMGQRCFMVFGKTNTNGFCCGEPGKLENVTRELEREISRMRPSRQRRAFQMQ
jgi:hypothetical protein